MSTSIAENELGAVRDEASEVDHALHALAARGRAHELEVARWLLRAEALAVHRRFGFGSLAQYVEQRLGLGPRELREKLRVARALAGLPLTAEALRRGEQSWSAVRELTRVVTADTEAEWLAHSRGRTVRQLERRVARHRPGDSPQTRRSEAHRARRLVFELPPEDLGKVRAALDAVWAALGPDSTRGTPGGLLVAMAEVVLGQRDVATPAYQTALTVCGGCARTWSRAGGEQVEVSDAVAACAACDGEVVGFAALDAEDDALADGGAPGSTPHVGHACGGRVSARDVGESTTNVGRACRSRVQTPGPDAQSAHGDDGPDDASRFAADASPAIASSADDDDATHVGRAMVDASAPADDPGGASAPLVSTTHVGHEAAALAYLRDIASRGGARPLLRVMTRALGVPLRSVTPQLRRMVFARDGSRCVVPGCGHWRFIDVHHVVPQARGGVNRLDNLVCLCTAHHRAIHDGVLALEGSATQGWVVRHAGGVLQGRG